MRYLTDGKRHLICLPYTVDNLHLMAQRLGIRKCWFHKGRKPHYDIPATRYDEITAQCEVVSSKEIVKIISES